MTVDYLDLAELDLQCLKMSEAVALVERPTSSWENE